MKTSKVVQLAAPLVALMAGVAHAAGAGASPMAAVFTTVEGWLTGDIAEWLGICAIVGLGALIWFAHDYGHIFGYIFKGFLASPWWCLRSPSTPPPLPAAPPSAPVRF